MRDPGASKDSRVELLLDAQTGRPVGSRSFYGETEPGLYALWTFAVVG